MLNCSSNHLLVQEKQECIPVGCVPPAHWPYLPACSALGGCLLRRGCLLQGGVCSQGVSALGGVCSKGGVCSRGVSAPGGVCSWGCLLLRGCLLPRRVYPSMHWGRHPPCEQNSWHTPMKILLCPKLRLRTVNIHIRRIVSYWHQLRC